MPHARAKFQQLQAAHVAPFPRPFVPDEAQNPRPAEQSSSPRFAEIYLHPPETICLMQLRHFLRAPIASAWEAVISSISKG